VNIQPHTERPVVVAVDGPAASGKSTISRLLAQKLGFIYVDTGAMYRTVTWKALEMGVNVEDTIAVIGMMHTVKVSFEIVNQAARMLVDGVFPGDAIRDLRVAEKVSVVAAVPEVRQILVQHQRSLLKFGSLVMEGRDIGSVVFPDSPYKFYIDADPAVRAERRQKDFEAMNISASTEKVAQNLADRDRKDSGRATAPLQIALGATVIDNSRYPAEETVKIIMDHMRQQGLRRGALTIGS
jgi:cytidylate kinase